MSRIGEMKEGIIELLRVKGKLSLVDILNEMERRIPPEEGEDNLRVEKDREYPSPYTELVTEALRLLIEEEKVKEEDSLYCLS